MTKNNANNKNDACRLNIPTADAQEKLNTRIEKGKEIQATTIISDRELSKQKDQFNKWNNYNIQLLKTIFTTNEYADEYNKSSILVNFSDYTLATEISDFHKLVNTRIHRLESIIERLELISLADDKEAQPLKHVDKNKVFIVHGHDDLAKTQVARFIEKMGLQPIILHEQASGSQTIIEKIESNTDVGFGVVLYTPCDKGAKETEISNLQNRARQNVVFEHGFLIGKLGRNNVCPLVKGIIETPNDISGIVYTSMNDEGWKISLARELKKAGYNIDMNLVFS